jgi:transposase-like protein
LDAGHWEGSEERRAVWNPTQSRTVTNSAGDVEMKVLKFCKGSFFPELLDAPPGIDRAL